MISSVTVSNKLVGVPSVVGPDDIIPLSGTVILLDTGSLVIIFLL